MKEEDRQRAIRTKLVRSERLAVVGIPTGFADLDAVLGTSGWPRGSLVEIFGPPVCGKTALLLSSIAHLQERGAAAAWIDADHTFDPTWAADLGMKIECMPVMQPGSAEDALAMAQRLAASQAIDLLVIDSVAALVPSLELEVALGEQSPGLQGRVLGSGLRRLAAAVYRSGASAVLINQARIRRNALGEETETSAGGAPLKLNPAIRIMMESTTGGAKLKLVRNTIAEGAQEGYLLWKTGGGFVESP